MPSGFPSGACCLASCLFSPMRVIACIRSCICWPKLLLYLLLLLLLLPRFLFPTIHPSIFKPCLKLPCPMLFSLFYSFYGCFLRYFLSAISPIHDLRIIVSKERAI